MAVPNAPGAQGRPADIVCEFHKTLENGHSEAESGKPARGATQVSLEEQRSYQFCCLYKTEETFQFYRDVNNYVLADLQDSACLIADRVDSELVKRDDDLGKRLKDAAKLLKALRTALHDSNNGACALRNCIDSLIGFKDEAPSDQKQEIIDETHAIVRASQESSERSSKAAEAIITIAGIHTFSDLSTLPPRASLLKEKIEVFKKAVDGWALAATEEAVKVQQELDKNAKELNKAEFEYFDYCAASEGYSSTMKFLCEGTCQPIECVEEICKKVTCQTKSEGEGGKSFLADDRD